MGDFAFFSIYVDKMKDWMHISYMTSTKGKTMSIKKNHGDIKGGETFKVIDPNYVDCGRIGKVGNQFDTHLTLHFDNGDYFCYSYESVERVEQ